MPKPPKPKSPGRRQPSKRGRSDTKRDPRPARLPSGTPPSPPAPPAGPFRIVGIGASAGGLEAMSELLEALPPRPGLALVFVQHLSPEHASSLVPLLQRTTSLPVLAASDRQPVQPNHLYVISPGTSLRLENGLFRVQPVPAPTHPPSVVDDFLRSLSEDADGRGMGIILSGMGSDGVEGIKALKAAGAITFVQEPQTAAFDGMPLNAIATGCVDFALPLGALAAELVRMVRHPPLLPSPEDARAEQAQATVREILQLVHRVTGVDLSEYKPPALLRRIGRRMLLRREEDPARYLDFLREHREEVEALQQDLLIHVTSFFRDPETFETLSQSVFPKLLEAHPPSQPLRLWVAGCATGEEVYSLVIALVEVIERKRLSVPVQVFGTDISESAIEKARAGIYPATIEATVSPERLRRFFAPRDGGYQVAKALRDVCVFARQNLIADPPFSRLDLISCRNVLIYLGAPLQQQVLSTFHFALQPQGVLLLGSSETVGAAAELFALQDRKHRIYSKKSAAGMRALALRAVDSVPGKLLHAVRLAPPPAERFDAEREADQHILRAYGPPAVIINAHFDVVSFRGKTGPYVQPMPGAASLNLLRLVHEELSFELRSALSRARRSSKPVRKEGLQLEGVTPAQGINLEVRPLNPSAPAEQRQYLVIFEENPLPEPARPARPRSRPTRRFAEVQEELSATRRHLQAIIEEQQGSNEELRALNEESQSTNEELQSTNEELETAKEELQSTNEELITVNEELQTRNAELTQANDDLINLLASVNIAIVMLSRELRIRRFTPVAQDVFNLIPSDVGRPLGDLKPKLAFADLEEQIRRVIETLELYEREVQDASGRWFSVRIRPYRTADNRIDGAVLTLLDVNGLRRSYEEAQGARAFAEAIVETVRHPLVVLDAALNVRTANAAFYEAFGLSSDNTLGQPLLSLVESAFDAPKLRELLVEVLPRDKRLDDFLLERGAAGLERRRLLLSARRLQTVPGGDPLILLSMRDADR